MVGSGGLPDPRAIRSNVRKGIKFKVLKSYKFRVALLGGIGTFFQIADGIRDLAFKS